MVSERLRPSATSPGTSGLVPKYRRPFRVCTRTRMATSSTFARCTRRFTMLSGARTHYIRPCAAVRDASAQARLLRVNPGVSWLFSLLRQCARRCAERILCKPHEHWRFSLCWMLVRSTAGRPFIDSKSRGPKDRGGSSPSSSTNASATTHKVSLVEIKRARSLSGQGSFNRPIRFSGWRPCEACGGCRARIPSPRRRPHPSPSACPTH